MTTFQAHGETLELQNLGSSFDETIDIDVKIRHTNACGWIVLCKILNEAGFASLDIAELKNIMIRIKGLESYQPCDKMIDYKVIENVAQLFKVRILVYAIDSKIKGLPVYELHMYGDLKHRLLDHAMVLDYYGRHFYYN